MLNKRQIVFAWRNIALAKIIGDHLSGLGDVSKHGYIAFVAFVCPQCRTLVCYHFSSIDIQCQIFAVTQCSLEQMLINCIASHDYELAGRLPLQRAREILTELKRQMAGEGERHG